MTELSYFYILKINFFERNFVFLIEELAEIVFSIIFWSLSLEEIFVGLGREMLFLIVWKSDCGVGVVFADVLMEKSFLWALNKYFYSFF